MILVLLLLILLFLFFKTRKEEFTGVDIHFGMFNYDRFNYDENSGLYVRYENIDQFSHKVTTCDKYLYETYVAAHIKSNDVERRIMDYCPYSDGAKYRKIEDKPIAMPETFDCTVSTCTRVIKTEVGDLVTACDAQNLSYIKAANGTERDLQKNCERYDAINVNSLGQSMVQEQYNTSEERLAEAKRIAESPEVKFKIAQMEIKEAQERARLKAMEAKKVDYILLEFTLDKIGKVIENFAEEILNKVGNGIEKTFGL